MYPGFFSGHRTQRYLNFSMKITVSSCPRDCYSTCSFKVSVKNGKIGLIEPHPDNLATGEGICLKGLSYPERNSSRKRLLNPLIKRNGKFVEILWEEAYLTIAKKITSIIGSFGNKAILYYTATGTKGVLNGVGKKFWELIGGCTLTYGDLCWPAGLEATRLTLGDNIHNAPWDIENAKLIFLWGKNSAETNIHQIKFIENARRKGAKVVVVDPRRTETSGYGDIHLRPDHGTDGALALGIAHLLIKKDLIDREFIENNVKGFEEYSKLLAEYSPDRVSKITSVPANLINEIADLFGAFSPVTISAGFGMQRYRNSGQSMRAIIALLAITGNIGKRGSGWVYANLQSHIFDDVRDPVAFFPPEVPEDTFRYSISVAKLGEGILNSKDPPIKMAWVERGNPVCQNPDTNSVLKAFRSLDFLVVVDQFLTDSAREADLVLPAKSMFEQTDIINAYWHSYIQIKQKVLEPPGNVLPETEIYYNLALRMGFGKKDLMGEIPEPGDQNIERYLGEKLKKFPDITLDKLRQGPIPAPDSVEIAYEDLKFKTPSGKIELFSETARKMWGVNPLPVYTSPFKSYKDKKYPFIMMTPNTKNGIHSQFYFLKLIKQFSDGPVLYMNPLDCKKLKLNENDKVILFNDNGKLKTEIRLSPGLKSGSVLMYNGFRIDEGGGVNFLTSQVETDMGYGAAFHEVKVDIRKVK